jgi:hypothetical protein
MNTQEHIKNCKECGNGFYCKGLDLCIKCQLKSGSGFTVSVNDETNAYLLEQRRQDLEDGLSDVKNRLRSDPESAYRQMVSGHNIRGSSVGGKNHREAQRQSNIRYSDLADTAVSHVVPTYTKAEITHEQFKHHVTFGSTAEFLRKTDEDQESVSFNEWLSWIVATTIVIWLVIVVML